MVDATENEDLLRNLWDPKLVEALAKDVDLTIIDDVDDACWDDPALEGCASIEIILPRNTEVMAYLKVTRSYAGEAARELGILVEEANNIVITHRSGTGDTYPEWAIRRDDEEILSRYS